MNQPRQDFDIFNTPPTMPADPNERVKYHQDVAHKLADIDDATLEAQLNMVKSNPQMIRAQ
jgi:hypothetical protein